MDKAVRTGVRHETAIDRPATAIDLRETAILTAASGLDAQQRTNKFFVEQQTSAQKSENPDW